MKKAIPEYPGYFADSDGNIWGLRGYILKWNYNKEGYPRVSVRQNSKHYVHKLVCLAFYGPRPKGLQCRHLDGDKNNARPENLRYGTSRENADDTIRLGSIRGSKHPRSKLTEVYVVEMRELYRTGQMNQAQLAKKYGVSQPNISLALRGKTVWGHVPNPCEKKIPAYSRKFTSDQILAIKASKLSQRELAHNYGVCRSTIQKILNHEN